MNSEKAIVTGDAIMDGAPRNNVRVALANSIWFLRTFLERCANVSFGLQLVIE